MTKIFVIFFCVFVFSGCKKHRAASPTNKGFSEGIKGNFAIVEDQVKLFSNMLNEYKQIYGTYPGSLTAVDDLEKAGYQEILEQLQDPYYPGTTPGTGEGFLKYPKIYGYINLEEMAETACAVTNLCDAGGLDVAKLKAYGYLAISRGGDFDFEFEDPSLNLEEDANQIFLNIMNYIVRTVQDETVVFDNEQNLDGDIIYTQNGILKRSTIVPPSLP